jgi:hypothetical protein
VLHARNAQGAHGREDEHEELSRAKEDVTYASVEVAEWRLYPLNESGLTLELSGRCRVTHKDTATRPQRSA